MISRTEAKFLAIDLEDTRHRLHELRAKVKKPMGMVRSALVDHLGRKLEKRDNVSVVLSDESDTAVLDYIQYSEQRPANVKHAFVGMDSYEDGLEILEKLGLRIISIQESRQELWKLGSVELAIIERPWLKPYLQIIGPSEAAIRDVAARMGLPWSQAVVGGDTIAYAAQYPGIRLDIGENINHVEEIRFGSSMPKWLKDRQES